MRRGYARAEAAAKDAFERAKFERELILQEQEEQVRAQRRLAPAKLRGPNEPGGVSIPVDYTSYLAPVAAAKLWNEAKHSKTLDPHLQAFETPYVVKLHNALPLAPAKLSFTFKHPNPDWPDSIDNTR